MIKLLLIKILLLLNLYGFANSNELDLFQQLTTKIHKSINYGVGSNNTFFDDEIIKYGEGHCGHLSWMLVRKLINYGYDSEIISITTYNGRNHSMVQVK